jgi:hypothetical protein
VEPNSFQVPTIVVFAAWTFGQELADPHETLMPDFPWFCVQYAAALYCE